MTRSPDSPPGEPPPPTALIGVDWGPVGVRALRLSAEGQVLATADEHDWRPRVAAEGHGVIYAELRHALGVTDGVPGLLSGAVGGQRGWIDAGYVDCPAGPAELGAALVPTPTDPDSFVVPGLRLDTVEHCDLMRGEETRLAGLLESVPGARDGIRDGIVCLPGHHSKWVRLAGGRVQRFATHLTGELIELCRRHGTPGRTMRGARHDERAFTAGVDASAKPGGVQHHLFAARALPRTGRLRPEQVHPWLTGLLIGHECRAMRARWTEASAVVLVGAPETMARYASALRRIGVTAVQIDGAVAMARGLARLARRAGLIAAR